MSEVSEVAGKPAAVAPRRRGAKPPGGAKRADTKTVRVQLHLGEQTTKRLNVHAALVGRNSSRVADKVLLSWLRQKGKGREIFPDDPTEELSDDDE